MPPLGSKLDHATGRFIPLEEQQHQTMAPSASQSFPSPSPSRRKRHHTPQPRQLPPVAEAKGGAEAAVAKSMAELMRATAGAQRAAGAQRRRNKRCKWRQSWIYKRVRKLLGGSTLFILFMMLRHKGIFSGVEQVTQAMAEVTQAVGSLASVAANATSKVSHVAEDVILVASGAADEFYRGVDVLNASFSRSSSKAVGRSAGELAAWVAMG